MPYMETGEKAAFVIGGLVETVLLVASMLGFIGAIVRKQSFVQIYAHIIYVHFVINVAVAGYLLYVITHFSSTAVEKACQGTVVDAGAQDQCAGFFKTARGIFVGVAAIVLITELYGALIVARYVRQIKGEKKTARQSRLSVMKENDIRMRNRNSSRSSGLPPVDFSQDFDPYGEVGNHQGVPASRGTFGGGTTGDSHRYESVPDAEDGYGGGSWSHRQISEEEKARMKRLDEERNDDDDDNDTQLQNPFEVAGRDNKAAARSPPLVQGSTDPLPKYTLSDPGVGTGRTPNLS
ncbi:hypothetical protein VNI00_003953 [Paramarasmius palmivorus]|uniref:MARVEL domain-containing protein n=1 Tax=Paramarasmius palmivorus TaxID=297713 RepID=A0AAW0DKP1_9AGAR